MICAFHSAQNSGNVGSIRLDYLGSPLKVRSLRPASAPCLFPCPWISIMSQIPTPGDPTDRA